MSLLFILLNELRPNLEANLLTEEQILKIIDEIFLLSSVHILLIRDLNACKNGHNLRNSDKVYLILFLLDIQDLLFHADINYLKQLLLCQSLLPDCYGAFDVGFAEDTSEEFFYLVSDFFVGEHDEDEIEEFYQFGEVEDCGPDEHQGLRVETVYVDSQFCNGE